MNLEQRNVQNFCIHKKANILAGLKLNDIFDEPFKGLTCLGR